KVRTLQPRITSITGLWRIAVIQSKCSNMKELPGLSCGLAPAGAGFELREARGRGRHQLAVLGVLYDVAVGDLSARVFLARLEDRGTAGHRGEPERIVV